MTRTLVLTVLFSISYYLLDRWAFALLLCVVGILLMLNNLITFSLPVVTSGTRMSQEE